MMNYIENHKIIKLTFLFVLLSINAFSQVDFDCEQLDIYQIKIDEDEADILLHELEYGPNLVFVCTLKNTADTNILLTSRLSKVELTFYYKNEKFTKKPILDDIYKNIELSPQEIFKFRFYSFIFFRNKIGKRSKLDYTKEVIEVLPTLQVKYSDRYIPPTKCFIDNVKVHL